MSTTHTTEDGYRLSSYTDGVQCVGVRLNEAGEIDVVNNNRRGDGELSFTRGEMRAFILGVKAGEFDDLT